MESSELKSKRTKRTRQLFVGGIALLLIMSVVAGVSLVAVQPAGAQSPTPISSCTTITSSGIYALTTDITGSANETCIDVRADDVVFDGGGHAVDGADASNSTGIRSVSRTNVTVENVRLDGWKDGVRVETNTGDTLRNVVADNNTNTGILLNNSTGVDVRDSTTNGNYYGIYSGFGDNETLTNVTTTNNRDGIVLRRSKSSNTVTNTTATDNQDGVYVVFSSDTTIANTNASGNNFSGIGVTSSDGNVLTNVTASNNNRAGVSFESSDDNVLSGVTTTRNKWYGIQFDGETHNNTLTNTIANRNRRGIHLFTGHNYTLTNTTANGNKRYGIDLSYSDNSTFENTVTDDNGGSGVILTDTSNGNTLVDTIANDNGGDGLSIGYSHRITVTNVTTNSNLGTGIALESDFTPVSKAVANDNGRNGIALDSSTTTSVTSATANGNQRDGLVVYNDQNSSIENSTTASNGRYGILFDEGRNNTLTKNTISANENAGIEADTKLADNQIYDNLLNNTQNVLFYRMFDNRSNAWNTSKRTGPNVIGGPTLGGNYYARPNGTGFSQTCTDANGDGICDRPNDFGVDNNNTDYLPLAHPGSSPNITVSPHNLSFGDVYVGETATANVTITNTGTNTLRVTRTAISGPNTSSFGIVGDGVPIRPRESQRVAVTFAPTSQGTKRATLSIASNDPDQPTVAVALRGTATPEDQRSVFPHPLRIALHPTVSFTVGPPRDLNGDRLYEDVNDDHKFGVKDVVALEIVVSANQHGYLHLNERQVAALDFNQDGTLGQKDVGVLAYGLFISRR